MNRQTSRLFFTAALITVLCFSGMAQNDPRALEILDAMYKKYNALTSFEADITVNMVNEGERINEVIKGKVTVKGHMYRLVLGDQEVINNGTTLWTYSSAVKEVNIVNYDPASEEINPARMHEFYKSGYRYQYIGDATENGVLCDVVDLVPEKRDTQYVKIRMNIAKKDRKIQSWTMSDRSGNRYAYTVTKFTRNVAVNDSFFTFDPQKYPNVEINDLR